MKVEEFIAQIQSSEWFSGEFKSNLNDPEFARKVFERYQAASEKYKPSIRFDPPQSPVNDVIRISWRLGYAYGIASTDSRLVIPSWYV